MPSATPKRGTPAKASKAAKVAFERVLKDLEKESREFRTSQSQSKTVCYVVTV
jgi:hypothetical protein